MSRIRPPLVQPVLFEDLFFDAPHSLPGIVVARGASDGPPLWSVQVVPSPSDPNEELDVQLVYITHLQVDVAHRTLIVTDELGKQRTLDITTRAVTAE